MLPHLIWIGVIVCGGLLAYARFGSIASVNGKAISRLQYIENMEAQSGEQVLDQMITEALIEQEAENKKVVIEQSVIDEEIKKIEEQLKTQERSLDEALEAEGMVRADLERQIRLQKSIEKMAASNEEISDEQIKEFLDQNKEMLPEGKTDEELTELAREQLAGQNQNNAIMAWLDELKANAKIVRK